MKKLALLTATGVATFLVLGLATPETTPDTAPAAASNAARPAPQITPDKTPVEEDDPNWNCFTDGNRDCGTAPHVTQSLADALAEGDDTAPRRATTRNWELCVLLEGDTSLRPRRSLINCPDGYTESS